MLVMPWSEEAEVDLTAYLRSSKTRSRGVPLPGEYLLLPAQASQPAPNDQENVADQGGDAADADFLQRTMLVGCGHMRPLMVRAAMYSSGLTRGG